MDFDDALIAWIQVPDASGNRQEDVRNLIVRILKLTSESAIDFMETHPDVGEEEKLAAIMGCVYQLALTAIDLIDHEGSA